MLGKNGFSCYGLLNKTKTKTKQRQNKIKTKVIPPTKFLELVGSHSGFSMALARSLKEKQGVFSALDKFRVHLFNGVTQGKLDFNRLVQLYKDMQPAIHHKINSSEIDPDSWVYAIKRLPSNITSTFTILMSKRITNVLSGYFFDNFFLCRFLLYHLLLLSR